MLVLTVQPVVWPAQFEVWFWLKKNWPTMVSAFRISRERKVTLPPALKVCRPRMWVTLSKICRLPRFVMSGWLPFAPRLREPPCSNWIWVMADVTSLMLTPGMPAASARFRP